MEVHDTVQEAVINTIPKKEKCKKSKWLSEEAWEKEMATPPASLPGESQGQRSLVGCHLWGRTESDMTEVT